MHLSGMEPSITIKTGSSTASCLRTGIWVLVVAILGVNIQPSHAAGFISPPVSPESDSSDSLTVGASVGWLQDKDASFWGFAIDYSHPLSERWGLNGGIAYDKETERRTDQVSKVVNTFSALVTISYQLSEQFSLTTGLSQGFADDDNADQDLKFKGGDLGTGLALGWSYPLSGNRYFTLSGAYEYNISEGEYSISFDSGITFSFR